MSSADRGADGAGAAGGAATGRVLVAGASGYLGGFVVRELKRRGWWVRALVRDPRRLGALADLVDDVRGGDLTRPAGLTGACDSVDVVFSSVGLMQRQGSLTFQEVDHLGNRNLLGEARAAGASRFIYVSSLGGRRNRHLEIVRAHEDFALDLAGSGMPHAVVRPTGYFSDIGEILRMARGGRVFLFGHGDRRINPIHGADLAVVCADAAAAGGATDIDVGGPEILTYRQIAEAAFAALGRPPRITGVPAWLARAGARNLRHLSRHTGDVLVFLTETALSDTIGPAVGTRRLGDYFARLVRSGARVERAQDRAGD
ncbi:MAG TPA: SDR family oxidoreductase [Kofleriaceae bacterium]|nr:SDR family oxidoreductase [Kofleriaceae bacterium]